MIFKGSMLHRVLKKISFFLLLDEYKVLPREENTKLLVNSIAIKKSRGRDTNLEKKSLDH